MSFNFDQFQDEIEKLIAEENFDAARSLLAEYAEPVAENLRGEPFRIPVVFRGSLQTARTVEEANVAIGIFTRLSRAIRNGECQRRIRANPDQLRVLEEGDSWFQYPVLLDELNDNVGREFAVYSISAPGDTAEEGAGLGTCGDDRAAPTGCLHAVDGRQRRVGRRSVHSPAE